VARPREVELRKGVVLRASTSRVPPRHLLVTYEDVSVQRRAEGERDQARADAREAAERQTAMTEVLGLINESPGALDPVFDAIARKASLLCDADFSGLWLVEGDVALGGGGYKVPDAFREHVLQQRVPVTYLIGSTTRRRAYVQVPDLRETDAYKQGLPFSVAAVELGGIRTYLCVPLWDGETLVGLFALQRFEVRPFTDPQIALLQAFAAQALIAIKNARLFNETREALERQTATAEILRVISRSPTDIQPVLDAVAESAARLCEAADCSIFRLDDDRLVLAAHHGSITTPGPIGAFSISLSQGSVAGRTVLDARTIHVADIHAAADEYPRTIEVTRAIGFGTMLSVPLIRDGVAIGVIQLPRTEIRPFTDRQIALLETFADQAVIAIENTRLFNETKDALERQTATAQILEVISRSQTDLQPVFDTIADSAMRLCDGDQGVVGVYDGELIHLASLKGKGPEEEANTRKAWPRPPGRGSVTARAVLTRAIAHVPDVLKDPDYELSTTAQAGGWRSVVSVPMLRAGSPIGVISVTRRDPIAFSTEQIALLKTFADQAVIAIENVRLFNETKEALERQTATAEILKVISESPTDVQPVFDAITRSAAQLFPTCITGILMREGDQVALNGLAGPTHIDQGAMARTFPVPFDPEKSLVARVIASCNVMQIVDSESPDSPEAAKQAGRAVGFRSLTAAPLVREGVGIGAISVASPEAGIRLSEKQVSLLQTFADQAVIAIENVRLFNETKEALERQTATAEILKVISESPTDTQPVFDAIAESARKLFGNAEVGMALIRGDAIELVAAAGMSEERLGALRASFPRPLNLVSTVNTTVVDGQLVHYPDMLADGVPSYTRDTVKSAGIRAMLGVPLLREGRSIGGLFLSRATPGAYSEHQIALLETFADQAVIAIENVRLFNETKEALERQTATAEILKVISESPTDVQPVFDAIVRASVSLCDGRLSTVLRYDGEFLDIVAHHNLGAEGLAMYHRVYPARVSRDVVAGCAILDRAVINLPDSQADGVPAKSRALAIAAGFRSVLVVPILREGEPIGIVNVARAEAGPFSQTHVDLLQTFADQAVIAIENVRLFKELEQRTEALTRSVGQLTALGEVSQTISSTLDLEKVLPTIVSRAVQLTGLDGGAIYEYDEARQVFALRADENVRQEILELDRSEPIRIGEGAIGRAAATRKPVQVPDIATAGARQTRGRDVLLQIGARALLAVPLLREGHILGALAVIRNTPGEFAPEVIALLDTFATQSAIAIQNARLFREIEDKSRQLELASQHKSQFLASMSHELRTPLNAILGFNELILGGIYGEIADDMRPPLEQMQGSGRHLLGLINNVLDLAKIEANRMELALADYSVHDVVSMVRSTLQSLATEKGLELVTAVPDDLPLAHGDGGRLSQCLINLAGNAIKFTKQGSVEISVALEDETLRFSVVDTGIGIPADKIGNLFTEFKQTDATVASEYGGTGLGLSITKKFIEMHGGRIWVESAPGEGSRFIFEVPLRVVAGAAA